MNSTHYPPIILISGPPGSGKSTLAARLAETAPAQRAVQLETDWFYRAIRKGFVPTWLPAAQAQNITVLDAFTASARVYAKGGYAVYVDGIMGPWYLEPWFKAVAAGFDVRLVVLRPARDVSLARAQARPSSSALVNPGLIVKMWGYFAELGAFESHVLDTSEQTLEESQALLAAGLAAGGFGLGAHQT